MFVLPEAKSISSQQTISAIEPAEFGIYYADAVFELLKLSICHFQFLGEVIEQVIPAFQLSGQQAVIFQQALFVRSGLLQSGIESVQVGQNTRPLKFKRFPVLGYGGPNQEKKEEQQAKAFWYNDPVFQI